MNTYTSVSVLGQDVTTYTVGGSYVTAKSSLDPFYAPRYEIFQRLPEIGEKYEIVWFCDYENVDGRNDIIEVTAENLAEIAFHMNDLSNDLTEYVLING